MKVAVVGYGNVGMAVFRELQTIQRIDEIVLVGRNLERMQSEIRDYQDACMLRMSYAPALSCGGYEKTAGADIIIHTAGNGKTAVDRNAVMEENVRITTEIFTEIKKYNDKAIVIVLSNPLDIIVSAVWRATGFPASRIIGTGTLLDTARLNGFISELFEVSHRGVKSLVVGEHGASCVSVLSRSTIFGMTLEKYLQLETEGAGAIQMEALSKKIKEWAFRIYAGKGSTSYGVAACAAWIVSAICCDSREYLPVSTVLNGEFGVQDFAISAPCMIGAEGRISVGLMKLSEQEERDFRASAAFLEEMNRLAFGTKGQG